MAPTATSPTLPATRRAPTSTTISTLRTALCSESTPLAQRYRALFALKHVASTHPPTPFTLPALHAIAAAFQSPSALLKHEVAYCLGQTGSLEARPYLRSRLEDEAEDPMCRHEAAEALGALGDAESLDLLRRFRDRKDVPGVVRETCEIAVERIEWVGSDEGKGGTRKSAFASIDPAPPLAQAQGAVDISSIKSTLLDMRLPLFQRFRAMFTLRDLASPPNAPSAVPAVQALAAGFSDPSALFRHEIAFVFGQLSHPASIPSLVEVLGNLTEESMVRHEAAEALGSLGEEEGVEEILKGFLNDREQIVRESVIVALDMAEFEKSDEAEYAMLPSKEEFSPLATIKT